MRGKRILGSYLCVQAGLFAGSFLVFGRWAVVIQLVVVTTGVVALLSAVGLRRPDRRAGWWLIVVSALFAYAEGLSLAFTYGLRTAPTITTLMPLTFGLIGAVALAAGLAVLGRRSGRFRTADYGDVLDTSMAAIGAFLIIWVFYVNPRLPTGVPQLAAVIAIAVPASSLLVFTTAVTFAFAGGWRTWSGRALLLAVLAWLSTAGLASFPVGAQTLVTALPETVVFVAYFILLGAAGTTPDFTQISAGLGPPATDLPRWRMALFVLLALLAPTNIAIELARAGTGALSTAAILVPVVCATLIFLLLVVRLGLISSIAHVRATELARRADLLARAAEEQHELQRQLSYRASHDPLTGLANRSMLTDRMAWIRDTYDEPHHPAHRGQALLMFDLDNFKDINDTYGHPVGDQLLIDVSRRLRKTVPPDAITVRLGGDEFAVLLEETSPAQARQRADEILEVMRSPYLVGGRELFTSVSVGLLITPPQQRPPDSAECLRDVDQALYAAKTAGKNRVVEFHRQLRVEQLDQARISTGLRNALSHDELLLHYQPIVSLRNGAIVAVEALLRWQPDHSELVPPSDFIPLAEKTGLIVDIGTWVMRQACLDASRWYPEHGITVEVNVSGRQLDDHTFAEMVLTTLSDAGLPASALVLELTESSLIETTTDPAVHRQLDLLRSRGVRIAIDDFGTGYSSLSYISRLPVDQVKIDSSFTPDTTEPGLPHQTWAFVRTILELISVLGLEAVAEGIETQEQAKALETLRCPLAQGHYFSRPLPADSLDELLRNTAPTPHVEWPKVVTAAASDHSGRR